MTTPVDVAAVVERATGERPRAVTLLKGVGNNLVAKIETAGGPLAAKIYFRHPGDPRDRLGVEFETLSFLWSSGLRSVPRPVLSHRGEGLGLYEFIDGESPSAHGIGWDEVDQLICFLGEFHDRRNLPGAGRLGNASEHGLSIPDYQAHVAERYTRLRQAVEMGQDLDVKSFVRGPLASSWERVVQFVERRAKKNSGVLDPSLRTLSPADHGFHNSLRRDGRLVFLDFEYAGWDDPAHVIANACLQPAVPMPEALREKFTRKASARLGGGTDLARRLRLLYPLLAYKWCLILLNEFLPVPGERRTFAGSDVEGRKAGQLAKAKKQREAAEAAASDGFFLDKEA